MCPNLHASPNHKRVRTHFVPRFIPFISLGTSSQLPICKRNMMYRLSSSFGSMQHTSSEGSPVDPPSSAWSPFMGGAGRKRSIGSNLTDAGNGGIKIPNKVGASAHGGLEYHRYFASVAKSAAAAHSYSLVLMVQASIHLFLYA